MLAVCKPRICWNISFCCTSSILIVMLWQRCAKSLVGLRRNTLLVRFRKRTCFSLKYFFFSPQLRLEMFQHLIKNIQFRCYQHGCKCPLMLTKIFCFVSTITAGKCPCVALNMSSCFTHAHTDFKPLISHQYASISTPNFENMLCMLLYRL